MASLVSLTLIWRNALWSSRGSNDDRYPFEATAEAVWPVITEPDSAACAWVPMTAGKPSAPATTAGPAPLKKSRRVVGTVSLPLQRHRLRCLFHPFPPGLRCGACGKTLLPALADSSKRFQA